MHKYTLNRGKSPAADENQPKNAPSSISTWMITSNRLQDILRNVVRYEWPHDQTAHDEGSDEQSSQYEFGNWEDLFESDDSKVRVEIGQETENCGGYFG